MFNARLLPLLLSLVGLVQAIDWFEVENLSGPQLAQAFNWETGGGWDNGGIPLYVNSVTARRNNMWTIPSTGQNIFRVSQTPNVDPYRMSTRISSKKSYSGGGLFVFDVAHIPSGYGLWPALWMVGVPNWPHMGEIDIIEGVHTTTQNTQSFHTGPNCTMQKDGFSNTFTMTYDPNNLKYTCDAYAADNQGCSTRDGNQRSYGSPFNQQGGGVFVVQWDFNGIAIYSFPRGKVPADITAGVPRNANWGTPTAYLANTNCSIFDNFYGMKMVINTNLCGAWAGGVWKDDLWYAGAPGSPAAKTGYADCNTYMKRGGAAALRQAYWTINSIKIYNQTIEWVPVPVSTSPLPIPTLIG